VTETLAPRGGRGLLRIFVLAIVVYRRVVSPWLGPRCRFHPTCSCYAQEAIVRHGWRGIPLVAGRLLRCHPWNEGGVDPVPEHLEHLTGGNSVA